MKKIHNVLSATLLSISMLSFIPSYSYASSTIQDSILLNSGLDSSGQLAFKSDVQYYKISPNQDGDVFLSLENVSAELAAQIIDQNGTQFGYLDTYYDSNKSLHTNLKAGTYFIKVFGSNWNNSTNSAKFNIKAVYPNDQNTGTGPTNNQTIGNATTMNSGQNIQGSLISNADVNYYKFMSEGDGNLYVRLENLTSPVRVSVLDQNNQEVIHADSNSTQNFAIEHKIPKGSYYIKVTPLSWGPSTTQGTYTIIPTFVTQNVTHNDQFEPNDTMESAYRLHSDEEYQMNLSSDVDVNYYKVQLDHLGSLHLTFDQISHPIIAQIFDSQGTSIGYMDSNVSKTLDSALEQGTIYIKVSPSHWDDHTTGTYTLKASFPEDTNYKVKVNGINLVTDQPPVMINGRTLVPFRSIFEALGATVYWDGSNQLVTAIKGNTTITMPIGSTAAKINGNAEQLDVPATIINGRTMVPVRFVSEGLNDQVDWDRENWAVNITDNKKANTINSQTTLPSVTQNAVTVTINKVSIVNGDPIFDVSVSNKSQDYIQVTGFGIEQIGGGSVKTSSSQLDGSWLNKINPGSTISGKISAPVEVDPLIPTLRLNVNIQAVGSTSNTLYQLDTPMP